MTINRLDACKSLVAAFAVPALLELPTLASAAELGAKPGVKMLLQQPLPNVPGKQLSLIHVTYPPASASPAHRHPGFTVAYVLSGQVVSKVGDEAQRVYGSGEWFTETPYAAHEVSRNASDTQPATLLAVLITDVGANPNLPLEDSHA